MPFGCSLYCVPGCGDPHTLLGDDENASLGSVDHRLRRDRRPRRLLRSRAWPRSGRSRSATERTTPTSSSAAIARRSTSRLSSRVMCALVVIYRSNIARRRRICTHVGVARPRGRGRLLLGMRQRPLGSVQAEASATLRDASSARARRTERASHSCAITAQLRLEDLQALRIALADRNVVITVDSVEHVHRIGTAARNAILSH